MVRACAVTRITPVFLSMPWGLAFSALKKIGCLHRFFSSYRRGTLFFIPQKNTRFIVSFARCGRDTQIRCDVQHVMVSFVDAPPPTQIENRRDAMCSMSWYPS